MTTRETDQERDQSVTLRLDRWASILRNEPIEELGLTDDEADDLSTLFSLTWIFVEDGIQEATYVGARQIISS